MAVTGGCGVNFPPREGCCAQYSECGVAVVQPDSLHPDSLHGDQVCDWDTGNTTQVGESDSSESSFCLYLGSFVNRPKCQTFL